MRSQTTKIYFHILYHILYSFLDNDLWPDDGLMKKAETCSQLNVRRSVHQSIIHAEIANKMQQCFEIYYSMFIWSSTCFGRHTAHHQGLKTALAASGFAYVKDCGCWSCWTLTVKITHYAEWWFDSMSFFSTQSLSSFTALRQQGKSVSMTCWYHSLSCSCS